MATHVDILIPVYNGVQYLEECVQSILAQTYQNFTIYIGINGHGYDGGTAGALAREIAVSDSRIKVYILESVVRNKVDALNALVQHTSADWIALCDCDDKWHPQKLATQLNFIGVADVIGTGAEYFGDMCGSPQIPYGAFSGCVCENVNPFINSSVLLKSEYCEFKYPNYVEALEDYYLWMKLALLSARFYNVNASLTFHRIHKSSAFNSKQIDDKPLVAWFKAKLEKM
jgi:glycosyltransferase involved in cell wall biosynthesis